MTLARFNHHRIAILGFGKEGQAAVALLAKEIDTPCIEVLEETPEPLPSLQLEMAGRMIPYHRGPNVFNNLTNYDVLIKSPGISSYRAEIETAVAAGVELTSGTQLWADAHQSERVIMITGTKGKSTTTSLLTHLLQHAGHKATLLGNIGQPALTQFHPTDPPELWIMELSSYQTKELQADPEIAVLLNLYPEHTDWHRSNDNYFRDKTRFLGGLQRGMAILNAKDDNTRNWVSPPRRRRYFNDASGFHVRAQHLYQGSQCILHTSQFPLQGTHNLENLAAVLTVIAELGYSPLTMLDELPSFRGLPHRLYSLGMSEGIEYVDDSISTTPQSALAALQAYSPRPCTLLLGGFDRQLDWHGFTRAAKSFNLHGVVTMPDNGAHIAAALRAVLPSLPIIQANSLEEAVPAAQTITPQGGVILLSPGAPSYGQFKNYQHRGQQFAALAGFSSTDALNKSR